MAELLRLSTDMAELLRQTTNIHSQAVFYHSFIIALHVLNSWRICIRTW